MQDTALYQQVLGLTSPWKVAEVGLNAEDRSVEVRVTSDQRRWPCPLCGADCPEHDRQSRRWRHLDTCQYQTILIAEVPRMKCSKHGVKQVSVPWADRGSRFTALFESLVLAWLQEACTAAVADLCGLSWSVIDGIQQRAIRRGLKRRALEGEPTGPPRHLGVDETSFQKRHEYVTVVCDQITGDVVHVADGRSKEALSEYLKRFSEEELGEVETIAMDMWEAYVSVVRELVPEADRKICFDKFHVAQYLGKAVDEVRRAEHKALLEQGDGSLKRSRFLWLSNPNHLDEPRLELLDALRRVAEKTSRAWALKETAMDVWRYRSRAWARKGLLRWYSWAIRSRLEPIRVVARMIKRRLEGIVNAIHHGVTNARAEGINSRIQWIKYTARGFRNRERFRRAIYFHLGGLDMEPESLKPIAFHRNQ